MVVKAHNAHLGISALIASAIDTKRIACGLPAGVFAMLVGSGTVIGTALVADPYIKTVGFTGSRSGGTAAFEHAQPVLPVDIFGVERRARCLIRGDQPALHHRPKMSGNPRASVQPQPPHCPRSKRSINRPS